MQYIAKSELQKAEQQVQALLSDIEKGVSWADKFLKDNVRKDTHAKIKKIRREIKKIRYALTQNPSSALYGESQVGKSYLIKNLLSRSGQPFKVKDLSTGQDYDFLEDINPAGGGTEATSVVSRFSTQVDIVDKAYPIKVLLLSPKDIALMLCDSYFSDVEDHENIPNTAAVLAYMDELLPQLGHASAEQNYFTEDDLYEIREYLNQHFRSFTSDLISHSAYWDTMAALIHRVAPHDWYKILQIIWGKNEHINQIFNRLIDALAQVEFVHVVYVEFRAVLRKGGTLLHVARLKEIHGEPVYEDVSQQDFVPKAELLFEGSSGAKKHSMNKSLLCALTAELIFSVDETLKDEKLFLNSSDLLDFPGARSRLKNQERKLSAFHIGDMVLRGKVAYIFNKYSSQYLISNLFFCNRDQKIEVTYIPKLLNTWIETYVGKTPEDREAFLANAPLPPLFMIFTFFNNDLTYNPINDKPDTLGDKWTKRFVTIFQKEIVKESNFNWHTNWSKSQPYFQNNYMLRDFHYSNTVFTGYRENGKEDGYHSFPSINNYPDKLRSAFLEHEFVKKHFVNSQEAWDEAASLNKDGSELIIRSLNKVASNYSRTQKFIRELNMLSEELNAEMNRHYHSDAADERIRKAAAQAGAIHIDMDIVFGANPNAFGDFVRNFTIKESVVYNFFKEKIQSLEIIAFANIKGLTLIRNANPGLSPKKSYDDNVAILMQTYKLPNKEAVEAHFDERGISLQDLFFGQTKTMKNNSEVLAEGIRDYWFEHYLCKENFQNIIEQNFSPSALEDLFDNMRLAFEKRGVTEKIAEHLRDYVDLYANIQQAEEMIADISATLINKFVTSVGWDFYSDTELQALRATNKANNLGLNFQADDAVHIAENEKLSELFDQMSDYARIVNELDLNRSVIGRFPNIYNISRWRDLMKMSFIANCDVPTYDILANQALGDLLKDLGKHRFSVSPTAA